MKYVIAIQFIGLCLLFLLVLHDRLESVKRDVRQLEYISNISETQLELVQDFYKGWTRIGGKWHWFQIDGGKVYMDGGLVNTH